MIKEHYPELFADEPAWAQRAAQLAHRTYELVSFLVDVLRRCAAVDADYAGTVTYHDVCSGLRELGVKQQPRTAAARRSRACSSRSCRVPRSAAASAARSASSIRRSPTRWSAKRPPTSPRTGADTLLAGDMGCLLNMAGKLKREGTTIGVRHVAEVLAGMTDEVPPIGDTRRER